MKIPWVPVTSGGGSIGPVEPTKSFMENYSTATNPIGHKAFQNLPLDTACPAVKVESVNKSNKRALQSTKIREAVDGIVGGAGEQYVDSYITKPIQGNYQGILLDLERQRVDTEVAKRNAAEMATLAQVAEAGYKNLGESADEEKMNSLRDRLRFAGASEEEVEEILKQQKKERLMAKIKVPLSSEQKQMMMAEEMYKTMIRSKTEQAISGAVAYRPPADPNVYNFPMPGAASYAGVNEYAEPGNEIFAGRANAGVNPAGPGSAASSSSAFASSEAYRAYLRRQDEERERRGEAAGRYRAELTRLMGQYRRPEPIVEVPARLPSDIVTFQGPVVGKAPNILAGLDVPRERPFPMLRRPGPAGRTPQLQFTPLMSRVLETAARTRVAPPVPMMLEDRKPAPAAEALAIPSQFGVVQRRGRPRFSENVEKYLGISKDEQSVLSDTDYQKLKNKAKVAARKESKKGGK